MRTVFSWLAVAAFLAAGACWAAEPAAKPQKSWLKTWFEHLKQGLSESAVQGHYQKSKVTAVAAVRGAAQETTDPGKPQWKSGRKAKRASALKKERAEFSQAVDLILDGKTEEGLQKLEAFEKAHPKSALLTDVQEAREKAKQWQAEAAPPTAETPEPPAKE